MSDTAYSPQTTDRDSVRDDRTDRRVSTETKASVKTSEMVVFIAAVVGVLVAAQISDASGAQDAWLYVTLLTIGYLVSRGLAKSGSREFYDESTSR
jgi:uncharacterized membrane protein YbjE (DUF340 family)